MPEGSCKATSEMPQRSNLHSEVSPEPKWPACHAHSFSPTSTVGASNQHASFAKLDEHMTTLQFV
jgi:hypothetical protein